MKTRIITGVAVAIGVLLLVLKAPVNAMLGVVLVIGILSYLEYDRLFFHERSFPRVVGMSILLFVVLLAIEKGFSKGALALFSGFSAIAIAHVLIAPKAQNLEKVLNSLTLHVLGLLYVSCLTGFLLPIVEYGREILLLLFFMVFLGDTMAYFIGSKYGKRKLIPSVSPNKSIEGSIAAIGTSLVIAIVWILFFMEDGFSNSDSLKLLIFAPILSVFAQLGDLFESLLKRSVAVKDSGQFLPGHGGMLDRIDALCFAAPAFYLFLKYCMENL